MENDGETWEWHQKDYHSERNSNITDSSTHAWSGVITNQEDLSYMFDETTPIKACGDVAYQVADSEGMVKEPEILRETSLQTKRRRMLQFDDEQSLCCKELASSFLTTKEIECSMEDTIPEVSPWPSGFTDMYASYYEGQDLSCDDWLADCLNDTEMNFSTGDLDFSAGSDVQIDVSEYCNIEPEHEVNTVQERTPRKIVFKDYCNNEPEHEANIVQERTPRKIVFKGSKSLLRTPSKSPSSIAYPFAFIKPCGVQGDVTLKDINQRIRTPPRSKEKEKLEDPMAAYPTSAFSGKPVVGKTKIHTEGGKGSITIMRTKG